MIGCPPDIIFHSKRWLADLTKTVQECLITHKLSQKNILSPLGSGLLLKTLGILEAKTSVYDLVSSWVSFIFVLFRGLLRTTLKESIEFPKQCYSILCRLLVPWWPFCYVIAEHVILFKAFFQTNVLSFITILELFPFRV